MSYVPSRTFCCCIPTRIGVIIIALLGILLGGAGAIFGIVRLAQNTDDWSNVTKVSACITTIIYALFCLISILGLWGALGKRYGMVRTFFVTLTINVILNIATGSFALYTYFKDTQANIDKCVADSDSDLKKASCKGGVQVFNGCMVGLYIFIWLLQIYGCVIVNDYSKQLMEEKYVKAKDEAFNRSMGRV